MFSGSSDIGFHCSVWIGLIFVGSGNVMSAEHTSRFIVPFLTWLMPDISEERLLLIHVGIRKMGHITEYAILAWLLARAYFAGGDGRKAGVTVLIWLWGVCVILAAADEFRQSFAESRGASPWDIMIDAAGAIFGLLIYSRRLRRGQPRIDGH